MKYTKGHYGWQLDLYRSDTRTITFWQEPTWFNDELEFGIKFRKRGVEAHFGKFLWRGFWGSY